MKLVGVDVAADLHDLAVGDALFPQDDVGADGTREQEHVLQHLAEVPAQRGDLDLADVDAVDQDLALLELVVPADQGEDGALAGAGGAHKATSTPTSSSTSWTTGWTKRCVSAATTSPPGSGSRAALQVSGLSVCAYSAAFSCALWYCRGYSW